MRVLKSHFFKLFILLLLLTSCSKHESVQGVINTNPDEGKKVLFIGNSHTYYNSGIPNHINGFAGSLNIVADTDMSAQGGFSLSDHLQYQPTLDAISSEDWDIIVLQENSYRAAFESDLMLESIEAFDVLLEDSGAAVFLFKTWAYENDPDMLSLLNASYNQANILSDFPIISVGNIWKDFMDTHEISLYADDGIHPNQKGTYFSAAVFFKKFFNVNDINSATYQGYVEPEDAQAIKAFVSNIML